MRRRTVGTGLLIGLLGAVGTLGGWATAAWGAPVFAPVAGSPFPAGPVTDPPTPTAPMSTAFSPLGGLLATANRDGSSVSVFTMSAGGALTPAPDSPTLVGLNPASLAFDRSGAVLAVANTGLRTVSAFTVSGDGALTPVGGSPFDTLGGQPQSVAFSPTRDLLASANADPSAGPGTVSVFSVDPTTGALKQVAGSPFTTGSNPASVAFSPSGELLATADSRDNTVSVFTVDSDGALEAVPGSPLRTGGYPLSVAFGRSGGLVATANNRDSTVSVFSVDPTTGALEQVAGSPFPTGASPQSVAFSPSRDVLTTAGGRTVSAFSVSPTGSLTRLADTPIPGAPSAVGSLSGLVFNAVGNRLAAATNWGNSVVMLAPAPTAAIDAPADGSSFVVGQKVVTRFRCEDSPATAASGIASCQDGDGASAPSGRLDTSTLGSHTYAVTATNLDGQSQTQTIRYTVQASTLPVIGGLSAASGPAGGGQRITITGENLTANSEVLFDGQPASDVVVERYDRLTATTPAHAAGLVAVTVRTAAGTSPPVAYTYTASDDDTAGPPPAGRPSSAPTDRGCVVLDLYGRTIAAARERLQAAGCTLGRIHRTRARHGASTARVIRQSPAPHTAHPASTRVDITTRVRARG